MKGQTTESMNRLPKIVLDDLLRRSYETVVLDLNVEYHDALHAKITELKTKHAATPRLTRPSLNTRRALTNSMISTPAAGPDWPSFNCSRAETTIFFIGSLYSMASVTILPVNAAFAAGAG